VQEMQEISAFNFLYHHANRSQQNCKRAVFVFFTQIAEEPKKERILFVLCSLNCTFAKNQNEHEAKTIK
jgi:hypothetical protein